MRVHVRRTAVYFLIVIKSPLLVTCIAGNLEALQLLLAEGANLALKNEIGDSALHLCCLWGRSDMVKYLLDSKISLINVREQNCLGNTPLHKACAKGYSEIATMLTLKGASLLAVNNEGQTPVDVSAPECIKRI
jgi:ankyrin repeat protein